MGLGRTWAVALVGMSGVLIEVQADAGAGIPDARIVGTLSTAMKEARHRVKVAVRNSGLKWPDAKVIVNLAPADVPKHGSGFDLGIAVSVLCAGGVIRDARARRTVHIGELSLDGRVQPVRGVLPAVLAAVRSGRGQVMVPARNAAEASLVPGAEVTAVSDLTDVARHYGVSVAPAHTAPVDDAAPPAQPSAPERHEPVPDLREVLAQHHARYALEVAAAGGFHLLMQGPPGTGKSMLAARLPGLLPDLADAEAMEVTSVHSLCGTLQPEALIRRPPFVSPHHSASAPSIIGGGSGMARPGAISRAHCGVLFLDEAPEFSSRVLETLRQPLESGEVSLHRANAHTVYPARIQLVLAANPCPCGNAGSTRRTCTCTPQMQRRYAARLSGPVLDRVDLQIDVQPPTRADLAGAQEPEPTAVVAQRVRSARERTRQRLASTPWSGYAHVPGSWIRERTADAGSHLTRDLERARDRGQITMRGFDRVLRVAWTLSDLHGRRAPTSQDVAAAYTLRSREHHG